MDKAHLSLIGRDGLFLIKMKLYAVVSLNALWEYKTGYLAFIKSLERNHSINVFEVGKEEVSELYAIQIEDYIVWPFMSVMSTQSMFSVIGH